MRLTIFISIFIISISFIPITFASSEYVVNIAANSYNLGCEQDNSCFSPYIIKIETGDVVIWENLDSAIHIVKSLEESIEPFNFIESGLIKSGNSFTKDFINQGVFPYFCPLHPWMDGFVIVGDVEFNEDDFQKEISSPIILDENYILEEYVENLVTPINMEFVGNDLLVIEKNSGKVMHIKNGNLVSSPVLDLEVSNYAERGLLGITSVQNSVFLSFTESFHDGGLPLGLSIYKYDWNGETLDNPILINQLPLFEKTYIGGELVSDLNDNVFLVTGWSFKLGLTQNVPRDESFRHFSSDHLSNPDLRADVWDSFNYLFSCIKVSFQEQTSNPLGWQKDQPDMSEIPQETDLLHIGGNILSCLRNFSYDNFSNGNWEHTSSLLKVSPKTETYAIGIRNSFGLGVDPQTGNLWDTENGSDNFDEINLIHEKFNSGWSQTQGPLENNLKIIDEIEHFTYGDPKFSWEQPVGPTAIEFPNTSGFSEYQDFIFVADTNNGIIYKLKLDESRTNFIFDTPHLKDKVVNILDDSNVPYGTRFSEFSEPMDEIIFAKNLGIITDMKFGPDGSLYVISLLEGKIYKISLQ